MDNTYTDTTRTTLVIGATGKTGSRVAARLRDLGAPVKPASRSSETYFDWTDPTSWVEALDGVDATYITYFPDLALPGAAETVRTFVDVALEHGVRRHVLLAGRGEEGAERAERLLIESGADWTILRCGFFAQNFSEIFADPIRAGIMAMPEAAGPDPFLDIDDVADVAVAALTDDSHIGQLHELTGPRVVTMEEVAEILSAAIGRPVRYVPMPDDAYTAELVDAGLPPEVAGHLTEVIAQALDGRNTRVTDEVEKVLGRPARDFADYARVAAAEGAWDLPIAATA
jgi:uncharacterized protein YbjT (DUF2867 family)